MPVIPEETISAETTIDTLEIDSLVVADLMATVKREYGVDIRRRTGRCHHRRAGGPRPGRRLQSLMAPFADRLLLGLGTGPVL
ncbi:acyl carrier protein [Streptomyces sp. NPDC058371]|uniref:acyl carrier protein n=1 Tax=Streptomyces sp. NPDC058371 TaxID=3346463 RepID=UPI003652EFE7